MYWLGLENHQIIYSKAVILYILALCQNNVNLPYKIVLQKVTTTKLNDLVEVRMA